MRHSLRVHAPVSTAPFCYAALLPAAPDPDPAPAPPKPRKRWRPRVRFSLRTLVVGVLLVGSGVALWLHWQPWYQQVRITEDFKQMSFAAFSRDCKRVVWLDEDSVVHVSDAQTGTEISTQTARKAELVTTGVFDGRPILVTAGLLLDADGATLTAPEPRKETPWKVELRARRAKPVTFDFAATPLDDCLNRFLKTEFKAQFVYSQELIDAGTPQTEVNLRSTEMDPVLAVEWVLRLADVEAEFEGGVIHIVAKGTYDAQVRARIPTFCDANLPIGVPRQAEAEGSQHNVPASHQPEGTGAHGSRAQ